MSTFCFQHLLQVWREITETEWEWSQGVSVCLVTHFNLNETPIRNTRRLILLFLHCVLFSQLPTLLKLGFLCHLYNSHRSLILGKWDPCWFCTWPFTVYPSVTILSLAEKGALLRDFSYWVSWLLSWLKLSNTSMLDSGDNFARHEILGPLRCVTIF